LGQPKIGRQYGVGQAHLRIGFANDVQAGAQRRCALPTEPRPAFLNAIPDHNVFAGRGRRDHPCLNHETVAWRQVGRQRARHPVIHDGSAVVALEVVAECNSAQSIGRPGTRAGVGENDRHRHRGAWWRDGDLGCLVRRPIGCEVRREAFPKWPVADQHADDHAGDQDEHGSSGHTDARGNPRLASVVGDGRHEAEARQHADDASAAKREGEGQETRQQAGDQDGASPSRRGDKQPGQQQRQGELEDYCRNVWVSQR
jgi:hypothetical protein